MIEFLHTFIPSRVLISFGPISIYWYGVFIVLGILTAIIVAIKLAGYYDVSKDTVIDLAFWLILSGLLGARLYFVLMEPAYYFTHPLDIFKFWQGGLAIHGALTGGLAAIWFYIKKYNLNFWLIGALLAPGVALAQAFGRWGNYFNQEVFGRPTSLPWGIPILPINRLAEYYNYQFFHPTFLYESLGCFLIFIILLVMHSRLIKTGSKNYHNILIFYFLFYSILRLAIESLRIDPVPVFGGWRLAQLVSLVVVFVCLFFLYHQYKNRQALEKN
jgi:phosphatidylglycerol:prolipoprotein diacylglycerol transferase